MTLVHRFRSWGVRAEASLPVLGLRIERGAASRVSSKSGPMGSVMTAGTWVACSIVVEGGLVPAVDVEPWSFAQERRRSRDMNPVGANMSLISETRSPSVVM